MAGIDGSPNNEIVTHNTIATDMKISRRAWNPYAQTTAAECHFTASIVIAVKIDITASGPNGTCEHNGIDASYEKKM